MALFTQQGNQITIHGAMTVDTVPALLAGVQLRAELQIDLKQVAEVDSSAISLMFEWLRLAQSNKAIVSYSNLPASLVSLAALYGVLDMIPQHKLH